MNLEDVADAIEMNGQPITLRRLAPQGIRFDVNVTAMVREYRPDEQTGGIVQGDRRVIISNRAIAQWQWPGPPRMGDQVIIAGKIATLKANPETIRVGNVVVRHTMLVSGA